ncbi:hypothetical protein Bca4012_030217 [Brassica carinata]|uniref:Uncharacterized protein n=1 Tax=Brassica carinata TaxID=52824 RepID=A0A8X7UT82_BRACI|nr:hypothetical protein Bca52824_048430 [Brassica carinata]
MFGTLRGRRVLAPPRERQGCSGGPVPEASCGVWYAGGWYSSPFRFISLHRLVGLWSSMATRRPFGVTSSFGFSNYGSTLVSSDVAAASFPKVQTLGFQSAFP